MKKYLLFFFCIGVMCIRCKKENQSNSNLLFGKWQFYNDVITRQGADACQYKSKPSDLYYPPSIPSCAKDNVWEFSSNRLTFHYGANKCRPEEPNQLVQEYQQTDSTLTINGKTYQIVMLSNDTFIIDNCQQINVNIPGSPPVGPNFIRMASKFYRVR